MRPCFYARFTVVVQAIKLDLSGPGAHVSIFYSENDHKTINYLDSLVICSH